MPDETEFDAVVIGSGLGGLTAAALLTKAGRKVCLLERNSGFGGSASGYRVGALTIEASLHQTADPHDPRDLKHHILKKLGLLDALTWVPLPDLYTVRGGPVGDAFTLPHGYAQARAALSERFPESRDGIGRAARPYGAHLRLPRRAGGGARGALAVQAGRQSVAHGEHRARLAPLAGGGLPAGVGR